MKSYKTGNLRKQVAEFRGRIERNSAALSNVFQSKQQQQEQLYRRDKILLMEHQAELSAEARKAEEEEEEEEEPNSFCNGIQYLNYRIPWYASSVVQSKDTYIRHLVEESSSYNRRRFQVFLETEATQRLREVSDL